MTRVDDDGLDGRGADVHPDHQFLGVLPRVIARFPSSRVPHDRLPRVPWKTSAVQEPTELTCQSTVRIGAAEGWQAKTVRLGR